MKVRARKSPRIETTVSATTAPFKSSGLVRARGLKLIQYFTSSKNIVRARKSPRIETINQCWINRVVTSGLVRARGLKQVTRVQNELKKASGLVRARGLKHPEIDALLAGLASGLVRARGLKLGAAVAELQVVRQGS